MESGLSEPLDCSPDTPRTTTPAARAIRIAVAGLSGADSKLVGKVLLRTREIKLIDQEELVPTAMLKLPNKKRV